MDPENGPLSFFRLPSPSLLFPLHALLDHDLLCFPLPVDCLPLPCVHRDPQQSMGSGVLEILCHLAWNHGSSTKLPLHIRHDFQARILDCSQAVRVEYSEFLQFFGHQRLQTSELDLIVQLILHLLLVARHV